MLGARTASTLEYVGAGLSVQPVPHVAHKLYVSQPYGCLSRLARKQAEVILTDWTVCFRCKMHEQIRKPTRDRSGFIQHVCTYIAERQTTISKCTFGPFNKCIPEDTFILEDTFIDLAVPPNGREG